MSARPLGFLSLKELGLPRIPVLETLERLDPLENVLQAPRERVVVQVMGGVGMGSVLLIHSSVMIDPFSSGVPSLLLL